ncbi:hypothetical protein MRQ36_12365 [Micromonospora sp. R77]|uniref:hypothetical protein n=1 Tax=Micromonospora sp. R77 TaxID=2925836 RepID=UPI001F624DE8|nr:hypothetical protein [Micromonospora sp. R77]MCI4063325.1 hypothetical protein [Micromonospora sp. R77]
MPPTAPRPAGPRRLAAPVALLVVLPLTACGTPPELRQPPPSAAVAPTASGSPVPVTPSVAPTTPGAPRPVPTPADLVATRCTDGPSGNRVARLLRGPDGILPAAVRVTVRTGPLCAGEWQYTVLAVTGHEELQVVTRGRSAALELVTAGTDVCGVQVRAVAPPGIRTLACDGTPGA